MVRTVLTAALIFLSSHATALTAQSYIVTEMDGKVLLEKNADQVRPIASITKIFTARDSLTRDQNELIEILPEDMKTGRMRSTPLHAHEKYTRGQLMNLALISSDNVAALALGRVGGPAQDLPPNTTVVEASGLNKDDRSSARELAAVARALMLTELSKITTTPTVTVNGKERHSTNPLLTRAGWAFSFSKTGFTDPAGGCLVVVFEAGNRLLTAVILGARDVPARWRDLVELRRLVDPTGVFADPPVKLVTKRKHRYNRRTQNHP